MTEKEKLLEYINKPVLTTARNRMGCDENWYNSYFAIKETFSIEAINSSLISAPILLSHLILSIRLAPPTIGSM